MKWYGYELQSYHVLSIECYPPKYQAAAPSSSYIVVWFSHMYLLVPISFISGKLGDVSVIFWAGHLIRPRQEVESSTQHQHVHKSSNCKPNDIKKTGKTAICHKKKEKWTLIWASMIDPAKMVIKDSYLKKKYSL